MRKKPPHRVYLEDALHALADMERTFAELESSDVFQVFTSTEKARYHDVLNRLRGLVRDLSRGHGAGAGRFLVLRYHGLFT